MFYTPIDCCRPSERKVLAHTDVNTVPKIEKSAFTVQVKLVSVYDGDTIWVAYYDRRFKKVMKRSCRMKGYDAPEMKPPKAAPDRQAIIENARKAKEVVENYYCKTVLFDINVTGTDKYGRWLVENDHLKKILMDKGLAYAYDGGKKIENFINVKIA
jgi:endonuclease YncB( thermonuclease family)